MPQRDQRLHPRGLRRAGTYAAAAPINTTVTAANVYGSPGATRYSIVSVLLQMWTVKPAYYGKRGGRLQIATSAVLMDLAAGRPKVD